MSLFCLFFFFSFKCEILLAFQLQYYRLQGHANKVWICLLPFSFFFFFVRVQMNTNLLFFFQIKAHLFFFNYTYSHFLPKKKLLNLDKNYVQKKEKSIFTVAGKLVIARAVLADFQPLWQKLSFTCQSYVFYPRLVGEVNFNI